MRERKHLARPTQNRLKEHAYISETREHCINANIRVRHICNSVVRVTRREFS
jgi:hypothetical protein